MFKIFEGNKHDKVQTACLIYLSIWITSPILAYGTLSRLIAFASILLWFLIELNNRLGIFYRPTKIFLLTLLYVLYTTIVNYIDSGIQNLNGSIQLYVILIFVIIGESYSLKGYRYLKPLLYTTLILMPIWLLLTYIGLENNARAARIAIKSSDEAIELSKSGVGGFSLIYFSVIYIAILLPIFKNFKLINKKSITIILLAGVNIVLSSIVIIKAQYSTALILLFFVYACWFMIGNKLNYTKIITGFFAMLIGYVVWLFKIDLLLFLSTILEGPNYQMKITDIIYSLQGNSVGTVDDRIERYIRSIDLFISNPIFGTISRNDIGKHSQFLDNFAQYGLIIGSLFFYIIMYKPYSYMFKCRNMFSMTFPSFVIIFALFGLNNIAMSYGLAISLLLPTVLNINERL